MEKFVNMGFSEMSACILHETFLKTEQALFDHLCEVGFSEETSFVLSKNNIGTNKLCSMDKADIYLIPGVDIYVLSDIERTLESIDTTPDPDTNREHIENLVVGQLQS